MFSKRNLNNLKNILPFQNSPEIQSMLDRLRGLGFNVWIIIILKYFFTNFLLCLANYNQIRNTKYLDILTYIKKYNKHIFLTTSTNQKFAPNPKNVFRTWNHLMRSIPFIFNLNIKCCKSLDVLRLLKTCSKSPLPIFSKNEEKSLDVSNLEKKSAMTSSCATNETHSSKKLSTPPRSRCSFTKRLIWIWFLPSTFEMKTHQ